MIKTLQKKFVVTAMTAIGILLLVLSLVLNIVNAYSSYAQNERVLNMLSQREFSILWQIPDEFGQDREHGFLQAPIGENTRRSSIYFIAYADSSGKILFIDTSKTAEITKEDALLIAQTAVENQKLSGRIGAYLYKAVKTQNDIGTAFVFLDITQGLNGVLRVLFTTFAIAALCFTFMLFVTIRLSKRAIRPIAENMEKQKNFVTDAGHEIKTPLAIISANTEALELFSGQNKWTKNIKEQTDRLSKLTQDLLALSRLDDTETDKMHETVSLSDIAVDTTSMFYENAALKSVIINEKIQTDITIKADKEHITRLISVLMDNAVKYCSEKSEIDVTLSKNDKKIILTVSNICDKLPDCEGEKLFERFYRGDSSHTQKSGGCGIGLAAAKTITELYKGKIKAEYSEENKITFTVIL